jgi:hypothetical protein
MYLQSLLYLAAVFLTLYLAAVAIRVFDRSRTTVDHFSWLLGGFGKILTALSFFMIQLGTILGILVLVWGIAYGPLKWSASHLSLAANSVLLFIMFLYFFLIMLLTGRQHFYAYFDTTAQHQGTLRAIAGSFRKDGLGFLLPLSIIIGLVMVGVTCFAALTAQFVKIGELSLTSNYSSSPFLGLEDQYLWHFFDLVPQLKVNETIGWDAPVTLTGTGAGWLLLAFKVLMIYIVIARFYTWAKWQRGELNEKKAANVLEKDDGIKEEPVHVHQSLS